MDNKQLLEIVPILKGEDEISIRLVDWFVTNYSKHNNIIINKISVYESYKLQLRELSKRNFDPFCRGYRIQQKVGDNIITTTNAQISFFKWAIHNKIIDYIRKNHQQITFSMNSLHNKFKKKTLPYNK
jgi:hypothetical protein